MAGMEQLEIHSRSYLVRWVNVSGQHTISWSIQPHKKPIAFGIFKHPGNGIASLPKTHSSTFEAPPTPGLFPADESHDHHRVHTSSTAIEKLQGIGLSLISWYGICDANKVSSGAYDVPVDGGGMYALALDNTFAKTYSKTVTLVLLTYPIGTPPRSNHQVQGPASGSTPSLRTLLGPKQKSEPSKTPDTIPRLTSVDEPEQSTSSSSLRQQHSETNLPSNFHTGILQKRRRKRHQGYARRYFSLDFTTATLSYYHDKRTLALRGAVPLSLAAIGANATTREISIDSGTEVWHLRAPNQREFGAWKNALESASKQSVGDSVSSNNRAMRRKPNFGSNIEEEREWVRIEELVTKIGNCRDSARLLAKDTDPKYLSPQFPSSARGSAVDLSRPLGTPSSDVSPPELTSNDEYFQNKERLPFWKRKSSGGKSISGAFGRRSVSAQPGISSIRNTQNVPERVPSLFPGQSLLDNFPEDDVHERSMILLQNLNNIMAEFNSLIMASKRRRSPNLVYTVSRMSLDSFGSQEFFDAEGGEVSQLLTIHPESDEELHSRVEEFHGDEQELSSASEIEDDESLDRSTAATKTTASIFPSKPKSLTPLPLPQVMRRTTVPPPTVSPPSLIGFLRKNVGKDLSTISTPVSANEPISLLQRVAEQLEYSSLLDEAAKHSSSRTESLLFVTAFAVSWLSALRVKERAVRKPFNPMLGETFELVREDKGFRFIAEKVSHRPLQMACQADSEHWCLTQSPMPTQKFWGKSAEVMTEGRVRVALFPGGDCFSWTQATCFLRNLIAGEKYVEPVGTMTITNETGGEQSIITFKSGGIFSGRSEDVSVRLLDNCGNELPVGLFGQWNQSLTIIENGTARPQPIWKVGELVPDASRCYGFTTFTASLNELSIRDKDYIAPTDSRLRPDQRAAEDGDIEKAEILKGKLEEAQRLRRKMIEDGGSEWRPMWFTRVEGLEGEVVWLLKGGRESYWEHRTRGGWSGVINVIAS